jgi:hypothetical protein
MSQEKRYVDQLDQLFSRILEELQAASDDEILAGESADTVKQRALGRLERAREVAGARRLSAARVVLDAKVADKGFPVVSIDVARAHISHVVSDSRYTLAARQLSEMSDEDILSVYSQLIELEKAKPESDER